jgi:hypothetical protein
VFVLKEDKKVGDYQKRKKRKKENDGKRKERHGYTTATLFMFDRVTFLNSARNRTLPQKSALLFSM